MKWVCVEEAFGWRTIDQDDPRHKHLRERQNQHYAEIPDDLYLRLEKDEEALKRTWELIDPYVNR